MFRNIFLLSTALFLLASTRLLSQNETAENIPSQSLELPDNEINCGSFIDQRDRKSYKTIDIGNQTWMAENLSFLPVVSPNNKASGSNSIYYVYGYEGSNVKTAKLTDNYKNYGVLYNWPAASSACPQGWHIPTGNDWDKLVDYLGHASVGGNKMKATGTIHWKESNKNVTNSTGFDALPGGVITVIKGRHYIQTRANFWSAEIRNSNNMSSKRLSDRSSWIEGTYFPKNSGLSVRCLKN